MNAVHRIAAAAAGLLLVGATPPLAAQGPPKAPINLEADVTSERVFLTWDTDDSGNRLSAETFRIYRDDEHIGTSSGEDHVDPDVEEGREYTYEVSGVDILGREGERSDPLTVVIPGGSQPAAPENLVAEAVSSSRLDLRWDPVGEDGDDGSEVVSYYIYRDGGDTPHDSTGGTQYSDTGLAAFTEYTYQVSAVSAGGVEGELSTPASARTFDDSPPSVPSSVEAEAAGAQLVELTWAPASDPESGVSLYLVYRDAGSTPIDSTSTTGYADSTVEPETSYSYQIAARNGDGLESAKSAVVEVTTPAATDATPPSAPGDVTAEAVAPDRVELTWSAAQDPESGVSSYRVYRDDALIGSSAGIGFVDLTVEPNTTYEYEVAAVNGDGLEGARAEAPPVTTPATEDPTDPVDTIPPAAPRDLRVITG